MNFEMSKRMESFQESIFSELAQLKKKKISEGLEIIDLSIGSPDLPPPDFVMDTLAEYTKKTEMYGYSLSGTDEFNDAVSNYYKKTNNVNLNKQTEITLLMGSQDGLIHLPLMLCNPGDYCLVPDPGYTAYATGVALAGAELYPLQLKKENGFLPDLKAIPINVREKAKLMILNFPGNPVPALATEAFFKEAIQFAKDHNIVILHDYAYSELYFEQKPISFLSVDGAKEVGIEMNSLSKSFNMAGCRIAYAAGNSKIVKMLEKFKSNLDYGVFLPVQSAAVKALQDKSSFLEENRATYKERRDILINGFRQLGWEVSSPKATMFIWAEVPESYTSKDFAFELLNKANIVVTPGTAFGENGEGFVRIALVQPKEKLEKVIDLLLESKIFSNKTIKNG